MSVTMNRSNTKPGLLEPTLGRLPDPTCRVATAVAPVMFQSCNLRIIAALWLGHPLHGVSNLIHIDAMRHPCTFKPGLAVALKIDPAALHGIFQSCWADSV